jgi:hypothetical protein
MSGTPRVHSSLCRALATYYPLRRCTRSDEDAAAFAKALEAALRA